MRIFAETDGLTEPEWLKLRTEGIGGSDVSAIAGLNPYQSAFQVWMLKTGLMEPEADDSEALHFGHVLEPVVRQEFSERTGLKVETPKAMFRHDEHGYMLANVDGLIRGENGELSIFEAKTASAFKLPQWKETVPEEYQLQVQHYMAVTGAEKAYVAALVGGNTFIWHEVPRDEELIGLITEIERDFWENHVLTKLPPNPDGSKATAQYLAERYPGKKGTSIELPDHMEASILEHQDLTERIEELKYRRDELTNRMKEALKDNEVGTVGGHIISWKTVQKSMFDQKRFKEDHPEEYKEYLKDSSYRRFSVA